jgi:murein DD-endopeptidase MepM/ murein hydrolase activator NlpD
LIFTCKRDGKDEQSYPPNEDKTSQPNIDTANQKSVGWYVPVKTADRKSINSIKLTDIGEFGLLRKERENVPAHYHTAIDIERPNENYSHEPVFSAHAGMIISIRDEGPYSEIIIEHTMPDDEFIWTIYQHVSEIKVEVFQKVSALQVIACFMNEVELKKYGQQFNHLHFEILKLPPEQVEEDQANPFRFFAGYSIKCFTEEELNNYYFNPMKFLKKEFENE